MNDFKPSLLSLSIGAGLVTRHCVSKTIDRMSDITKTGSALALCLAAGVGVAVKIGDPSDSLAGFAGIVTTGSLLFLLNRFSDYIKPVLSNGLGLSVTGASLYAGYSLFGTTSISDKKLDHGNDHHHGRMNNDNHYHERMNMGGLT